MNAFGITRVNRLRKAAERAREGRDLEFSLDRDSYQNCDGWSVSFIDPTNLLKVFKTLWLKEGFALHGYEFTSGGNGNGVIWAVPCDAPVLEPEECPRLEDVFLEPPKPPGAVELMKAIEGDGSPWSYLSASILCREAAEFGAVWHGSSWSEHTILWKPPWEMASLAASPIEVWEGGDIARDAWKPAYREQGETKEIVLHSYTRLENEAVYRATDTYQPGSYDLEMDVVRVCLGGPGYIH
jgi:hypothetical protein